MLGQAFRFLFGRVLMTLSISLPSPAVVCHDYIHSSIKFEKKSAIKGSSGGRKFLKKLILAFKVNMQSHLHTFFIALFFHF